MAKEITCPVCLKSVKIEQAKKFKECYLQVKGKTNNKIALIDTTIAICPHCSYIMMFKSDVCQFPSSHKMFQKKE